MASKSLVPDFGTPDKVQLLAEELQRVEYERAKDRALIDGQFNGEAPYSPEEAEKLKIEVNVNWNSGGLLLDDANRQLDSALIFKSRLAVITCKRGPVEKRAEWGEKFTELFNEVLMREEFGRYWTFMLRSRNASLSLHGIGALIWTTISTIKPRFVPLADLLIPTDTDCTLDDLSYFFTNLNLSQGELFDMVMADEAKWNKKAAFAVLHYLQNVNNRNQDPCSYTEDPEKWMEWRKQNRGFYNANNSSVPKVQLRAFYYRDVKEKAWYRKVLLRYDAYQGANIEGVSASKTFLYEDDEPFAKKLSQFFHIQYGDSSRVPPLKHHSVRGFGTSAYGPVECENRVFCQTVEHVMQDLLTWLRIDDPADRDRIKSVIIKQFAVFPRELQIIPKEERYQANREMLEMVQAQFKQKLNESSASYVADIDSGTKKETTLGEAQIRLQQVNLQVSGMLKLAYAQEVFLYSEEVRRLLMKGSTDDVVEAFKKNLKQAEIPEEFWVPEAWRVDIEQVLGAGDQTLAQYQANLMLSQRQNMDPGPARIAFRDWITVTTQDPAKARMLVPESPDKTTSGTIAAQNLFGTFMAGVETPLREGIDQTGYIDQMLTLMAQKVAAIKPPDVPQGQESPPPQYTMQELNGLANVGRDIEAHIALFEQDPANGSAVKQYRDALGQLNNYIKAMAQQLAEAEAKKAQQNGGDPKAAAAAQAKIMMAEVQSKIKEANAAQKMQHGQVKFQLEEARKDIQAMNELNREDLRGRQELAFKRMEAAIKILDAPGPNGSESN